MKKRIQIKKGEQFFIGSIKEIPPVLSQGKTIVEAKENVLDALKLYVDDIKSDHAYSTEFKAELDKRVNYYLNGGKMISADEMNTRLQTLRKKKK